MIYSTMTYAELKETFLFKKECERQLKAWIYRETDHPNAFVFAAEEAKRIVGCETLQQYMRVQRTGSKFPLQRKDKESLWLLYDNVRNHVSCAFIEMKLYDNKA